MENLMPRNSTKRLTVIPENIFKSRLRSLSPGNVAIRLFITCWLVYSVHFATNIVREIYPAVSLGDHLSFDVSEYVGLHPDIFEIPGRGAFINNNPGASMFGAIPYTLTRPVIELIVGRVERYRSASSITQREFNTPFPMRREFYRKAFERGLDVKLGLAAGVMQVFMMAPISALSVVVMFYVLFHLTRSMQASLAIAFLYAFATPVFYRTAQLNQNLLVAHFAFFAFVLLWRPWDDPKHPKRPHYLLAGLLCGWTVVFDYSGLVVVLVLSIYALVRWGQLPAQTRSRYDLLFYSGGVAVGGAVLILYQWSSFGHPIYPAQHYMPQTQFSQYGYSGIDWPSLDLLWASAFGLKFGLFVFAPILLLALYIPAWLNNRIRIVDARETLYIVTFCLAFSLFSAANQFGYMQFNTGVRHIVPVTPFLFLVVAGVLLRLPSRLAVLIGIITTYWSWTLAMYREVADHGAIYAVTQITLGGFRLPWLTTLDYMGYISNRILVIPLLLLVGVIILGVWWLRLPTSLNFRDSG